MFKYCGKAVQRLGARQGEIRAHSSTVAHIATLTARIVRGKDRVLPAFTNALPASFSTAFLRILTGVDSHFSPLSPVPITITTRTKER